MRSKIALASACLLLLACVAQLSHAQENTNNRPQPSPRRVPVQSIKPDLVIREYQFAPTNNKGLRVNVANVGNSAAGACRLRLTIRKIKGASVGRTMEMDVPSIAAGADAWVTFIADSILPNDVDIKDTTFKLNVDVNNAVNESKEGNNEKWHNL